MIVKMNERKEKAEKTWFETAMIDRRSYKVLNYITAQLSNTSPDRGDEE